MFFFFSFNFLYNLTRCRLGDFDVIFITVFKRKKIIYILRVSSPPQKKSSGCDLAVQW
jgi:hypothetical protein